MGVSRQPKKGAGVTGMLSRLMTRSAEELDRAVGWPRLPRPLAILVLIGLRDRLRTRNLYDSGRVPGEPLFENPPGSDPVGARTLNGTHNDLHDPLMGSIGCPFGRNVPLPHAYPEPPAQIMEPSPRLVSQRLLTREYFQPATTLNLLAAAWIQFEVHDWFRHPIDDKSHPWDIPLEEQDPWANRGVMTINRTASDPSPDRSSPPTYLAQDTHWWDGSQLYGGTPAFAEELRSRDKGQLKIDRLGLVPREVEKLLHKDVAPNFWVGLSILHSLFMREHNAICERLASLYPRMCDQELYDKARLINAALMAKIHTVDWTPAIIDHPTTVRAMRANWFGLLGERFRRRFGRITDNEWISGIPGSPTNHHGVPYSLTEEFVAVYRMHQLIPDNFFFRSLDDDRIVREHEFPDLDADHVRQRLHEMPMADIFYSLGRSYPGAISLHNYPKHLRDLKRGDQRLDLATADILRVRERGVPRYNEFRRLFRLKPASSFEQLTDNPVWAEELRQTYGDVERVDLLIGLYAEPKPKGFGFSDTAFRVFVLMASRRLESDRFFTDDFRPEIYTQAGMDWISKNTMRTVLLRHFPVLAPALEGVSNPFAPWRPAGSKNRERTQSEMTDTTESADATRTYVRYSPQLEWRRPDEDKDIDRIVKALRRNNERAFKKYKHGVRDAHAKSHAILKGTLTVYDGLPPELAQGMFATPNKTYDVIARLSSTSGVLRSDRIRGVRGLGIKVLGVEGERALYDGKPALPDDNAKTQDFIMVTHREFLFADAREYRVKGVVTATLLSVLPDTALWVGAEILGAVNTHILPRFNKPLPPSLGVFVAPNTHILGETFYTSAPLRYGDYVAKMLVVPLSENVKALEGQLLPRDAGISAHRDTVLDFFRNQTAEYEVRVQLCTDPKNMPIEDATKEWKEDESPHRAVAKITFGPQNTYSPQRRAFGDDVLSFNSWRALEAHRPLGSINRLKLKVYEASSEFRHTVNDAPRIEPKDIAELPE
jgi:hypothetical protein